MLRVALLAGLLGTAAAFATPPGSSVRSGPPNYHPGAAITLTNRVAPLASVGLTSLTEAVPPDWTVGIISDGGSYQPAQRVIRWLWFDNLVRTVRFELIAPSNAAGPVSFSGTAAFDGELVPVTGLTNLSPAPPPTGTVARQLPAAYHPGESFAVSLTVTPEPGVALYGVEEQFPATWLVDFPGGGTLTAPGTIRWGPFVDPTPRVLTYTLTPPAGASALASFAGNGWFDATTVPTSGDASVPAAPLGGGTVTRSLPTHYTTGQAVPVGLAVAPDAGTLLQVIVESVPAGWTVANVSHGGIASGDGLSLYWGPFPDDTTRTLTYELVPPAAAQSNLSFAGTGWFDGLAAFTGGLTNLPWQAPPAGVVTRVLPPVARPGHALWITNEVAPDAAISTYALEEAVPAGWVVLDAGAGTYLPATHAVRWGPFFDATPRSLTWQVACPTNATGTVTFAGTAWFDSATVPIGGASNLLIAPPSQGVVVRAVPGYFQPGVAFIVTNHVSPDAGVGFFIVAETLPEGWGVTGISHGGFQQSAPNRVSWGPFSDDLARELTYTLLPPTNASGTLLFSGQAFFDATEVTIVGAASLAANSPPVLSALPDQTIRTDQPATFTFTATDAETASPDLVVTVSSANPALLPDQNLTLGWAGAARSLTVTPLADRDGDTTITLSASDGTFTTTGSFLLRLRIPPRLTQQPAARAIAKGGRAVFTVGAEGSAPLTYQWLRDGAALSGATGTSLSLSNVSLAQAGLYQARVANEVGAVTSVVAQLSVAAGLATVTGHLYYDANGNGQHDPGEPHLANVPVLVTDATNGVQTAITDPLGEWTAMVPPGVTVAQVDTHHASFLAQVPPYSVQTEGTDPTSLTVVAGEITFTDHDGFAGQFVDGYVFKDVPSAGGTVGRYDPGHDAPLPYLPVFFTNSEGGLIITVTDDDGYFQAFVPPGFTTVWVDQGSPNFPPGLVLTTDSFGEGGNPSTLSVPVGGTVRHNTGYIKASPTLAALASLTAHAEAGHVVVRWVMVTEMGVVGYDLQREAADGVWITVTAETVFAWNSVLGATYQVPDDGARARQTYRYQVIEYRESGEVILHGPQAVPVTGDPGVPVPITSVSREAGQLRLTWPAGDSPCLLERSPRLGPDADWTEVPLAAPDAASPCVPLADRAGFFRLFRLP